ncbi:hypothetical protein [Bacillus thermotolerans]|uniref:hypothetical protein n=1 Tax=Bacillus thermotolerans TaxID=1221996 RepID=UPI0005890F76|nr:hypothetical protein [Bacillus thermotolerans]KKB42079.1 hypothetical protein QY96_01553 [Bacillus thermotolerans]
MRLKKRNFPHPVLSPFSDDILNSSFQPTFTIESKGNKVGFQIKFDLENKDLERMIENQEAYFAVHLECKSTMQRFLETSYEPSASFEIDAKLLNKTVDINFFILSAVNKKNYSNSRMHDDFTGFSFAIKKGDILAYAKTQELELEKEQPENTEDIFSLQANYDSGNIPACTIERMDKIVVKIPKEQLDKIKVLIQFDESLNTILTQMYYVPALLDTLYYMQNIPDDDPGGDRDKPWYKSISARLEQLNITLDENEDNLLKITHRLLEDALSGTIEALESMVISEGDEEDELPD